MKTLPTKFRTWPEFYRSFVNDLKPDHTLIQFTEMLPNGERTIYNFTLDEIKARCFDEILYTTKEIVKSDSYLGNDGDIEIRLYIEREFMGIKTNYFGGPLQ